MKREGYSRHKKRYERENDTSIKNQQGKKKIIMSIRQLQNKGKFNLALTEINKYLKLYPGDSYGLYQKACILLDLQYLDEAESLYKEIIDKDLKNKYSSLYKLGIIAKHRENYDLAEQYFRINIETSPYPEIFSRVALAGLRFQDQDYDAASLILNGFYDKQEDPELVNDIYRRFRECPEENDDTNYICLEKAIILIDIGDSKQARKELQEAKFCNSKEEFMRRYYFLMGRIEQMEDNYKKSMEYLIKAKRGPKDKLYWNILIQMARGKTKLGYPEIGLNICEEIMRNMDDIKKHEKDFSEIKSDTIRVMGDAYQKLGNYDIAKDIYLQLNTDTLKEKGRPNPISFYSIGKMEFNRGNYQEALDNFEKADFSDHLRKKENQQFYKALSYLRLKKYEESYQIISAINTKNLRSHLKNEWNCTRIYLRIKTGRPIGQLEDRYTHNQIVNYDIERTIEHAKRPHNKGNRASCFSEDVDVEELIRNLPNILKGSQANLNRKFFFEIYEVKYPNVGYDRDGNKIHLLQVVTLPDCDNIITVFPKDQEYYDTLEEGLKGNSGEKKSLMKTSRVEKFYKKYGEIGKM